MIEETESGEGSSSRYIIKITCDKCSEMTIESHMFKQICMRELQKVGWRLYKEKYLCPDCITELLLNNMK